MKVPVLKTIAGLLALLGVILEIPISGWFIEFFSPTAKLYALNAFLLTASVVCFRGTATQSEQPLRKRAALWTLATLLLMAGIFSQLMLTFTTIPAPFDSFGWNPNGHNIQVGSRCVEARKTRVYNLSSGSGEIVLREIKPLSWGVRLVRKPIAVGDEVTGVDLRKIDSNSFSYQFDSDPADEAYRDYPLCTVHFKN
jgi:hypothetical protein